MNNFKDMMDKILAPIRIEGNSQSEAIKSYSKIEVPKPIENDSKEELELRYAEVMNKLLVDAQERDSIDVFYDVVTWRLAVMAHRGGPKAIGNILERFGAHLGSLSEVADAQLEADVLRWNGRQLN